MLEGNAIEVKDVNKKFKVFLDKGTTFKERILFRSRRTYEERNVLNAISFSVGKGETLGIIGHNGCGKSTLLKLLARIMYPDTGNIEICGRVSSLIELGAGFHPDMSGRENIHINASVFGLSRREIERRMDDIIAFSELEEYIDNPVRTYSSGMYMRLAFSVAINVNAEILLVDEILSVGDANFQAKCFEKLQEIKASGVTIVIVSHSLGQIEEICDRSIWINDGKIIEDGETPDVLSRYLEYMGEKRRENRKKEASEEADKGRRAMGRQINYMPFMCMDGPFEKKTDGIVLKRGAVLYGPYFDFHAGASLKWDIEIKLKEIDFITVSLMAGKGRKKMQDFVLEDGPNILEYTFSEAENDIEIVIRVNEGEVTVYKIAQI